MSTPSTQPLITRFSDFLEEGVTTTPPDQSVMGFLDADGVWADRTPAELDLTTGEDLTAAVGALQTQIDDIDDDISAITAGYVVSVNGRIGAVDLTAGDVGLDEVLNAQQLILANNLSDVPNKPIARTNLGLGSAATQNTSAFDAAGEASAVNTSLVLHEARDDNPHSVTKTQVGLGNADNTSDANKPVSTAQAIADAAVASAASTALATHTSNVSNPHLVTKAQVGLGNLTNFVPGSVVTLNADNSALNTVILGADGKLSSSVIPAIALSEFLGTVASQAAMLALDGDKGDWAIRSDTPAGGSSWWILIADDSSLIGSWQQINPTGNVWSVNGAVGTVVLTTSDITEGSRLYYTDERAQDAVASLIQNGTGISWSYNDGSNTLTPTVSLASFTTANLAENTNLYYTDARVLAYGDTRYARRATTILDGSLVFFNYDNNDLEDAGIQYEDLDQSAMPEEPLGTASEYDVGVNNEQIPLLGYDNQLRVAAMPIRAIFDYYATVGNVTTGETSLVSATILANQLAENGDKLTAEFGFSIVNSSSTKQVRVYFDTTGATLIFDTTALATVAAASLNLWITIIRESNTAVRCIVEMAATGLGTLTGATYTRVAASLTLSAASVLKVTGTAAGAGAATNDILMTMGSIQYSRKA